MFKAILRALLNLFKKEAVDLAPVVIDTVVKEATKPHLARPVPPPVKR